MSPRCTCWWACLTIPAGAVMYMEFDSTSKESFRIHLLLHFLQLGSELLYCLVNFFFIFALRPHLFVVLELS